MIKFTQFDEKFQDLKRIVANRGDDIFQIKQKMHKTDVSFSTDLVKHDMRLNEIESRLSNIDKTLAILRTYDLTKADKEEFDKLKDKVDNHVPDLKSFVDVKDMQQVFMHDTDR